MVALSQVTDGDAERGIALPLQRCNLPKCVIPAVLLHAGMTARAANGWVAVDEGGLRVRCRPLCSAVVKSCSCLAYQPVCELFFAHLSMLRVAFVS